MKRAEALGKGAAAVLGAGAAIAVGLFEKEPVQAEAVDDLQGLWSMSVTASGATYHYFYAIGHGSYTGTGDIDGRYMNMRFGPTVGAYVAAGPRRIRYRERGWTYDLSGKNIGSFSSEGTMEIDSTGQTLAGPGVYKMCDLKGAVTFSEQFVAKARKISP
jgi:hypothetical protein